MDFPAAAEGLILVDDVMPGSMGVLHLEQICFASVSMRVTDFFAMLCRSEERSDPLADSFEAEPDVLDGPVFPSRPTVDRYADD